jgi:hypothetical protein
MPGKNGKRYDEQFFPLLPALRSGGWDQFVGLDCPYDFIWKILPRLKSRMQDCEPGLTWRNFYDYEDPRKIRSAAFQSAFEKQWEILKDDPEFAESFTYGGVSLMPVLRDELKRIFLHILPECAHMLKVAKQILRRERPDGVMLTYETGPFQRALVIQASRMGIPTIGLQHGGIPFGHSDYMHSSVTATPQDDSLGFCVPEITCVWGEFWKRNLTEQGFYAPETVAVVGNWRYDHMISVSRGINILHQKRYLGIPDSKQVVAILSGTQKTVDYVRQCLDAVSAVPGCHPVIKLHPSENPEPVRRLIHRRGHSSDILIEGHLLELLTTANIVVCQYSTTIFDALLLEKPVIYANFSRLVGFEDLIAAGVCIYVDDPQLLAGAIDRGLNDKSMREGLAEARSEYLVDYFYEIDGCAGDRVVQTLQSLWDSRLTPRSRSKHHPDSIN